MTIASRFGFPSPISLNIIAKNMNNKTIKSLYKSIRSNLIDENGDSFSKREYCDLNPITIKITSTEI